jgi:hypothetical protein
MLSFTWEADKISGDTKALSRKALAAFTEDDSDDE